MTLKATLEGTFPGEYWNGRKMHIEITDSGQNGYSTMGSFIDSIAAFYNWKIIKIEEVEDVH